jgi:antitoxin HicB
MEMADWHALVPTDGHRLVGNKNRFARQSDRAGADLLLSAKIGGIARVHQEDASHSGERSNLGPEAPKGVGAMSKKNLGSSIDDFLKGEKIFDEAQAQAVKEVVAWQLAKAMKKKKISKSRMAALLKTSRSQVDRILDPKRDITLGSLQRAAALVGQRVVVELV